MQFTEIGFAIFLFAVFCIYWLLLRNNVRLRNLLLLGASYFFYGWWDFRFLFLILLTTASTYLCALGANGRYGKGITAFNIILNLGILIAFKYLGFFTENLQRLLSTFGWNMDWFTIDVLVPVGISFYTLQAISYSVDVYNRRISACRDALSFATFIAFFPQLVAGPIERAEDLLPQLQSRRDWNRRQAVSGLRMVLFGVVKKVACADFLALETDRLFQQIGAADSLTILKAATLFSLQIYFDFSAYSEIARGTARLLGVELMANFRFPFFSRNIAEFWRRWHISLMIWFRNYVYIPLGGSRRGAWRTYLNIAIVFLLSGLWHGAAWNFILWGACWAVINIASRALLKLKVPKGAILYADLPRIAFTFFIVAFTMYVFRCESWWQIFKGVKHSYIFLVAATVAWGAAKVLAGGILRGKTPKYASLIVPIALAAAFISVFIVKWPYGLRYYSWLPLAVVLLTEWHDRNSDYPFERVPAVRIVRYGMYWMLMLFALLSEPVDMTFIYFQF